MLGTNFNYPKKVTFTWFSYWCAIVRVLVFALKPMGYDYNNNYILFSIYYLFSGVLGVKIFDSYELILKKNQGTNHLYFFIVPTFIFFISTVLIGHYYPMTDTQISKFVDMGIMFPLFNIPTFIAKLGDIIFQQLMILSLVLGLENSGMNKKKIVILFTGVFLILHLPLLGIFKTFGLLFVIPSVIAGGVFSYLILNYKNGHFYSVLVHQSFYLILGIILRVIL